MYIVKSLDLTNWLANRGFRILKAEDSQADPRYKVFFFRDTRNLRDSIEEYLSTRKA